jgi:hypothetical protein
MSEQPEHSDRGVPPLPGSDEPLLPLSAKASALLVALVLAPGTYSRNRFFALFESAELAHARRRAQHVRSLLRELTEPWPDNAAPGPTALDVREERHGDEVWLEFRLSGYEYRRSARLSLLEAAALSYALERCGRGAASAEDRARVEAALAALEPPSAR